MLPFGEQLVLMWSVEFCLLACMAVLPSLKDSDCVVTYTGL